jgi:hypothetical protein
MNEGNNIGGGLGRKEEKRWMSKINKNLPKSSKTKNHHGKHSSSYCYDKSMLVVPTDKIRTKEKLKNISPNSRSHEIKPSGLRYVFLL